MTECKPFTATLFWKYQGNNKQYFENTVYYYLKFL